MPEHRTIEKYVKNKKQPLKKPRKSTCKELSNTAVMLIALSTMILLDRVYLNSDQEESGGPISKQSVTYDEEDNISTAFDSVHDDMQEKCDKVT